MGELTAIGFKPGRSAMHRLDPRTKQALLVGFSTASLWGSLTFLALLTTATLLGLRMADVRILRLVREIRYFLVLLVFIFGLRAVTLGDGWRPAFDTAAVIPSLIVCGRLLLVVLMGLAVMATTRTADIRAALVWYLTPVPLVNAKMAATMVGLVVRFLPLILLQAAEISDAQRARGADRRKNPLPRLNRFAMAMFRSVFLRADELAEALQARCYNEDRTLPELAFTRYDAWAAGVGALVTLTVVLP